MFILFVRRGNSGRSIMAEAFLRHICRARGIKGVEVGSAGIEPDERVNQKTIELMREVSMEVGDKKPQLLNSEMMRKAAMIIAMNKSIAEHIPDEWKGKVEVWDIEGLRGKNMDELRRIRDRIRERVMKITERIVETKNVA